MKLEETNEYLDEVLGVISEGERGHLEEGEMKLHRVRRSLDSIGDSIKDAEFAFKKLSSDEKRYAPQKVNLATSLRQISTSARVALRSLGEKV